MKQNTKTISKKVTVECLACSEKIHLDRNPKIGSYVICNGCDAAFQIIDLKPVLIDWPEYDDYTDYDEGYYDDVYDETDS
jgi:hypothetical protein